MIKKIFGALITLVITLSLFCIFFELGVRLYDSFSADAKKANLSETVYAQVPFLDLRLLPGIRFKDHPEIFKFFLTDFNTNSHGFRGKEFSTAKKDGIYRIVCIGASTTFGHGASSDAATYPAFLEAKLNRQGYHKKIEVINAGIPGYCSLQEMILFNAQLWEFSPDMIIIYSGWNDVSNIFRMEASNYEKMLVGSDRFVESRLCAEDKYWTKSRWAIVRQIGRWRYKADKKKRIVNTGYKQAMTKEDRKNLMVTNIKAYLENDYYFNRPFGVYSNCMESIIYLAREKGIKVVFLTLPAVVREKSSDELYRGFVKKFPDSVPFEKNDFYAQMRFLVQDKFNSLIRKLAMDNGCILVDLDRSFPSDSKVLDLFCDEAHFSDQGNEYTAALIAGEIIAKGAIK